MSRTRIYLAAAVLTYAAAVVLANVLTNHYGQVHWLGLAVTAGTYAAGAALLARDFVQRHATTVLGARWGVGLTLLVIVAAAPVSWVLSTPGLAKASTVAFLVAEVVDLLVFTPTRARYGFLPAALLSGIVSAPVDTWVFLHVAGFPVTTEAMGGQFAAKVLWATVIPLVVWTLVHRRSNLGAA